MRKIKDLKLNYRCYYLSSGTSRNDVFIASSPNGNLTIFSIEGVVLKKMNLGKELESIDFNHELKRIGFIDDKGISIIDYDNKLLNLIDGNYDAIFIKNKLLWSVKILDSDNVLIEIFDLEKYNLISSLNIKDVFGQSSYMFFEGFDENKTILYVGGGQDGQINYLLNLKNSKIEFLELGKFDTFPINVSANKNHFVNGNSEFFEIYSYPDLRLRHCVKFVDEIEYAENILYFGDDQILVQVEDQLRIYNTRLNSISIVNLFKENGKTYPSKYFEYSYRFGDSILMLYNSENIIIADKSNFEFRNENQLDFSFDK